MITDPVELLLLALGWLLLPGLVVGAVLGLRGWLLAGVAPALSMGFVAGAGVWFAWTDTAWRPGAVIVALLVVATLATVPVVLVRRWRLRRWSVPSAAHPAPADDWRWWHHLGVGAALLVTATVGVRTTFLVTGGFAEVNQTWDAFFHAGAIRFIADRGDPSPAALAAVGAPASTSFYMPDAYHCVGALVAQMSGAAVPSVINAMVAVLPLVLGLGLVALLRVATGRPAHAVCVALFSCVVAAVPYYMVGYGTLLPYATALVMLPGVLALVVVTLRAPDLRVAGALGVAAAGLLHAHPQVAFLAAMTAAIQLGWHVVSTRRLGLPLLRSLGVTAVVAGVLGAPVLLALTSVVTRADGIDWPAYTRPAGAVGDLLLFSVPGGFPQWWLVPLLLAGLVAIVGRGAAAVLRPLVVAAVVIAGLYVTAGAYDGELSLRLTSLWWNDRNRLGAAFALLAIVFVAVGAVWLRDAAVAPLLRRAGLLARVAPAVLLVLGLAGFAVLSEGAYAQPTRTALATAYSTDHVLSGVERAGLATVAQIVRDGGGGAVMNDPHDGCGWAYALHGTDMVFRTPLTGPFEWSEFGYDRERLFHSFDRMDTDAQVRQDVERLGVRWAVLCTGFIRSFQARAPGLYDVGGMASATRVFSNAEVRLYRIDDPEPVLTRG